MKHVVAWFGNRKITFQIFIIAYNSGGGGGNTPSSGGPQSASQGGVPADYSHSSSKKKKKLAEKILPQKVSVVMLYYICLKRVYVREPKVK